jgi:radical SAM protein with 4Fe4S-binding SPASM domain
MEHVSYSSFSAALHRTGAQLQAPMNVSFEVTRRCPLSCQHCYNNLPVGDRSARAREMSLDEHRRLLDELRDMGCLWLLYTGGEIFARPDFLDIYASAKQRGFIVTLFTNGTQITPAIADRLAELPPLAIEITLYGHTAATYERVTGVPGSHARCRRGIDLLLARKLPVKLKSVALTINRHEIDDMKSFAADLGVPFKFDAMMSPRLDCGLSPLDVRLTPEDLVELDLRDPARVNDWLAFAARYLNPAQSPPPDQVYFCGGGVSSFAVDPYGGMSICVLSEREKYDLRAGRVREGWETFLRAVRQRPITRETKCTACRIKPLCGMCPAHGELESGDPETPVDFLCEVAHLRAHTLGLTVAAHGDCEFCATGARHGSLLEAGARLHLTKTFPSRPLTLHNLRSASLNVVRDPSSQPAPAGACASGSCGACGDHDGTMTKAAS